MAGDDGLARDEAPRAAGGAGLVSVTFCRTVGEAAAARARVHEGPGSTTRPWPPRSRRGCCPWRPPTPSSPALAWVVDPPAAMELLARGVAGWRITVRHDGPRADVLDALARTGAAFLRTDPPAARGGDRARLAARGVRPASRSWSARSTEALDAIAAGAVDLVVGDWDPDAVGRAARRHRPPRPHRAHRPSARRSRSTTRGRRWRARSSPPGSGRSTARARRGRATPGRRGATSRRRSRRGACRPSGRTRPGARPAPRRASARIDPDLARILERSLRGHPAAGARDRAALPRPRAGGRGDRRGSPTRCASGAAARRSPTSSTATSTTPTSATSAAASAASRAAPRASTCAATPTS